MTPVGGVPQAQASRGWGRRVHRSAEPAHPETACARTCPRDLARVCSPPLPSPGSHVCEVRAAAGGDSEGDLQGGGARWRARRDAPGQARRKGGGPRATPNPPAHSARSSLPPGCPLAPAPLTRRSWPPLATGLRAGLPSAVRRGCRRQLVRFDDHGGGSRRSPRLSAPPAAPLTQVPCAPLPLREGRSHRPTWCAL